MHKIPADFPKNKLLGQRFEQVCFGENEIIFNLSGDIRISIFNAVLMPGWEAPRESYGAYANEMCALLGNTVTKVDFSDEIIRIHSNNLWIEMSDDSELYESFIFSFSGSIIAI